MKAKWRVGSYCSSCLWWSNDVSLVQVSLTGEETHVRYQEVRHIHQTTADLYHQTLSESVAEAAPSRRSLHRQDRLLPPTFFSLMFIWVQLEVFLLLKSSPLCWHLLCMYGWPFLSFKPSSVFNNKSLVHFSFYMFFQMQTPASGVVKDSPGPVSPLRPHKQSWGSQRRCMCLKLCKGFILTPD